MFILEVKQSLVCRRLRILTCTGEGQGLRDWGAGLEVRRQSQKHLAHDPSLV